MAGMDWAFFSKDYFLLKEQVEFRTGFLKTPVLPAWVCCSSSFKMLLLDEWKGHCITACDRQQVTFLSTELSVWHGCHLFSVTAGMCLCSCSMESLSKKQIIWLLRCFLCKRKFNTPATSEDEELSNTYFILQWVCGTSEPLLSITFCPADSAVLTPVLMIYCHRPLPRE